MEGVDFAGFPVLFCGVGLHAESRVQCGVYLSTVQSNGQVCGNSEFSALFRGDWTDDHHDSELVLVVRDNSCGIRQNR